MRADRDLTITYMKDFGLRSFGYTAEELIGRNVIGTTIPERDEAGRDLAAMAREIAAAPEQYRVNVHQSMRRGGELVWVSWTNRAQYDQQGRFVGILAVGNDLSQLKQAEQERERLQAQLLAAERAARRSASSLRDRQIRSSMVAKVRMRPMTSRRAAMVPLSASRSNCVCSGPVIIARLLLTRWATSLAMFSARSARVPAGAMEDDSAPR